MQHVAKVFADPGTVKRMAEEFEKRVEANQRAADRELPKIIKRLEEIEAGTLLVTALERGSMPEGIIAERLQRLRSSASCSYFRSDAGPRRSPANRVRSSS